MLKIASVVGARPQFIKLAPLNKRAKKRHTHTIVHTGQHYDYEMSKAFFDQLDIPQPDFNLEIGSGSHAWQTGQMLIKLGETLEEIKPDLVLVYGDTNSTLAGALVAVKLHIPVGHVESGYRSGDISMPEEVNRIVADRISQLLFAPTKNAVQNLLNEGLPQRQIFLVGDIMAESLLNNLEKIRRNEILERLHLEPGNYGLLTLHRPENTNNRQRLTDIVSSLSRINLPIVFPVHPRTTKYLEGYGLMNRISSSNIRPVPPMKYLDFLKLESEAAYVITDSGGIQEEAWLFRVPCITLRYNTERVETLEAGANTLVGADPGLILKAVENVRKKNFESGATPENWDGEVSKRILSAIDSNSSLLSIKPQSSIGSAHSS